VLVLGVVFSLVTAARPPRAFAGTPASPPATVNPAPVVQTVTASGPTVESNVTISTDTVWGPLGSPYVIRGRLFVAAAASLTLLPGTVVKLDGQSTGVTVYGQLLSLGTPSNRVVITSYKDDSAAGDTNGDGAASSPAAGDWSAFAVFSSDQSSSAVRATSVLDYTDIRYGGYGSGGGCSAYSSVETLSSKARLIIAHSLFTGSMYSGFYNGSSNADPMGYVGLYDNEFANSPCGVRIDSGSADVIGNTFDSSLSKFGFESLAPNGIRFWYNTVSSGLYVGWSPAPTRAQMDIRYNNLIGQVQALGSSQDVTDYSLNWWGHNINTDMVPACADDRTVSNPPYVWTVTSACPGAYQAQPHYFSTVLPALSGPAATSVQAAVAQADAPQYGPVNTATGALTFQADDLTVQDAGKQFTTQRTYRSDSAGTETDLGPGWSSSFSQALSAGVGGAASMTLADGRTIGFGTDPAAGYVAQPGVAAGYSSGAGGSSVTTPGQDTYQFDPTGALTGLQLGDPRVRPVPVLQPGQRRHPDRHQ
jgi:hypothetical protein